MSNVFTIRNFKETPLFKHADKIATLILDKKVYEANIYVSYEVPDQLKQQVKLIAQELIKMRHDKNE